VARGETADRTADFGTERDTAREADFRFGAARRTGVRDGLANTLFFFFIAVPLI